MDGPGCPQNLLSSNRRGKGATRRPRGAESLHVVGTLAPRVMAAHLGPDALRGGAVPRVVQHPTHSGTQPAR